MIKTFHILREIAANLGMGIGIIRNWRVKRGRTYSAALSDQVQLILDQFEFLVDNIGWDNIRNKVVAEIGRVTPRRTDFCFLVREPNGILPLTVSWAMFLGIRQRNCTPL